MMNQTNPFANSENLSQWVASALKTRGLDDLYQWQMLEYWMQVELYRAIESSQAGNWRHFGNYEQPYHTNCPRSGSKNPIKYVT